MCDTDQPPLSFHIGGTFFERMQADAEDERNFVEKAISWALRQIGKKRPGLAGRCVQLAQSESPSARWIGRDALHEFEKKGIKT
ncbi:MAG: hypothetical protein Kow002_09080 [Anaerolineales bacterium]